MADHVFRSLIKKYFSIDLLMELDKLSMRYDLNNNMKVIIINKMLEDAGIPFSKLGPGTNRHGISIDGYALKIALDKAGKMDNRREFKYSPLLYPYVVKVYESLKTGLIAVSEYVTSFDKDMYYSNQSKMRKILEEICSQYLVGDIGVSSKNYINWGVRDDGSICCLDFAYIYDISSEAFMCTCAERPYVEYDSDFNYLICPSCKKKYTFAQKRRAITNEMEENEIGDISRLGYVLHSAEEVQPINPAISIFMEVKNKKDDNSKSKEPEYDEDESQLNGWDNDSYEDKMNRINGN